MKPSKTLKSNSPNLKSQTISRPNVRDQFVISNERVICFEFAEVSNSKCELHAAENEGINNISDILQRLISRMLLKKSAEQDVIQL